MHLPILSNDNIQLRPYAPEHIEMTVQWLKKPLIQKMFGMVADISIEKHQAWLQNNEEVLKWAIYSDKYIGNIFLFINQKHHSAYFQIYLGDEQERGKKVGYYAMNLVLEYAFQELNIHRIWLHCFPENQPAIKLYQKLHFTFEGLEKESIYRDGIYLTQGRWALLKSEWQAYRGNI